MSTTFESAVLADRRDFFNQDKYKILTLKMNESQAETDEVSFDVSDGALDSDEESDQPKIIMWKEPVNGYSTSFTEKVYHRLAGPEPTLEEKVTRMLDALGYASQVNNCKKNQHGCNSSGRHNIQSIVSPAAVSKTCANPEKAQPFVNSGRKPAAETAHQHEKKKSLELCSNAEVSNPNSAAQILKSIEVDQPTGEGRFEPRKDVTSPLPDTPASPDQQDLSRDEAYFKPIIIHEVSSSKASSDIFTGSCDPAARGTDHSSFLASSQPDKKQQTQAECSVGVKKEPFCLTMQPDKNNKFKAFSGQNQHVDTQGKKFKRSPAKSSLSHQKHKRYLKLFQKYTKRFTSGFTQPPSNHELQEILEFEKLQVVVAREQEECQVYLKQMALQNPYLYNNLPQHVVKYTEEKEQKSWKRAENYSRYYTLHSCLPLNVASQPDCAATTLTLVQTLLQMGSKCGLVLPDQNPTSGGKNKRVVPADLDKITARFPPVHTANQRLSYSSTWNHEPSSKDSNLETLAHKYKCHIATTASVLQQLLANHSPDNSASWDIPVIVREYGSGSVSDKVVYLDKPLLPRGLSRSEKKTQFLQKALQTFVCQPTNEKWTLGTKDKTTPSQNKEGAQRGNLTGVIHNRSLATDDDGDDDPFGAAFSMEELETFGSAKMSSQAHKKMLVVKTETLNVSPGLAVSTESKMISAHKDQFSACVVSLINCSDQMQKTGLVETTTAAKRAKTVEILKENKLEPFSTVKPEPFTSNVIHPEEKSPSKSSLIDHIDTSDSEDCSLTIALPDSPLKHISNKPCQNLQRSRSSIFDDVPVPITFDERRITRSVSQQLHSPDRAKTASTSSEILNQENKQEQSDQPTSQNEEQKAGTVETPKSDKRSRALTVETVSPEESVTVAKRARKSPGEESGKTGSRGTAGVSASSMVQDGKKQGMRKPPILETASTPLDSILKEMTSGESTNFRVQENPGLYRQPGLTGQHIGYHLWNLSGINLLVRCTNHAFKRDARQLQKAVYVRAKPEWQVQEGLEQITMAEAVHDWLGCYLRPNSFLLRARVNMQNQEVVHLEELQLNQILPPALTFSPPCAFAFLKKVFTTLIQLPAGSYLISHEAGADYIQLKASSGTKRSGYDLHCRYMGLGVMNEVDKTVPWVPVDPTFILPHHWRLGHIPATFQPADFNPRKQNSEQYNRKKKKGRNKKKSN